uniref:Transposase Tc1-like domain-containing protein n=1 Tax=Esox lucius TaxID=8010 RepID=A0AAY5K9P1_ESOLU
MFHKMSKDIFPSELSIPNIVWRTTTAKINRRIVRMAKMQPVITSRKIRDDLKLPVSAVTVKRRLNEAELSAKSPIAEKMAFRNGVTYCALMRVRLFFSSTGVVDSTSDDPRVLNSSHRTLEMKDGSATIVVWGCFSYYGDGPSYPIPGNISLNTSKYLKRLFQKGLEWPAQSPGLNPIENLWGDIKYTVSESKPKTSQGLCNVVQSSCAEIPVSRCQRLVDSMQRRCAAVIKNKGYATKY